MIQDLCTTQSSQVFKEQLFAEGVDEAWSCSVTGMPTPPSPSPHGSGRSWEKEDVMGKRLESALSMLEFPGAELLTF